MIRLAILSDLHAAPTQAGDAPGKVRLFTDTVDQSPTSHPIHGLDELISREKLKADFVVCPGDMTNQANPQALGYVWRALHSLQDSFRAAKVLATVGNHDVDSRAHSIDSVPRESLMRLTPPFPAGIRSLSDQYWAHGYYIEECGLARFLVINTCWLHEARDELHRGAITKYTLERIESDLRERPANDLNIAIFHHHPHPHSELGLGSDDVIRNGDRLLESLAENANWLVVHGHKHHPKLEYAKGQFRTPVVFASGSFSGRVEGDNSLVSTNYFHLLEATAESGRLAGVVKSWSWIPGVGWTRYARQKASFPSRAGFGCRKRIEELISYVQMKVASDPFVEWNQLLDEEVELDYLMPKQLDALLRSLKEVGINADFDEFGFPVKLGRAA